MKTEKMIKLITEMAELIQFHELQETDSKALDLLLQAQEAKRAAMIDSEMDQFIEEVRVANICQMS